MRIISYYQNTSLEASQTQPASKKISWASSTFPRFWGSRNKTETFKTILVGNSKCPNSKSPNFKLINTQTKE